MYITQMLTECRRERRDGKAVGWLEDRCLGGGVGWSGKIQSKILFLGFDLMCTVQAIKLFFLQI